MEWPDIPLPESEASSETVRSVYIQLIGFDDISFATLLSPELTTISQPVQEMAKKAVELIVNNELTGMADGKFVFPVTLVARQTTMKRGDNL